MANQLIKVNDDSQAQWYWKSNPNSWTINEKEEWRRYSDIQSDIIEKAFNQKKKTKLVELDNYWIDLNDLIQISKHDKNKQRQIKRMLVNRNENACLREERFFFPEPLQKPFNEERLDGGYHGFIKEWEKKKKTKKILFFSKEQNMNDLANSEKIEQAVNGIIFEGNRLGETCEAQWLAEQLRTVKNKDTEEIRKCCIRLYSKECFLYKLVNTTLRENDKTKVDTLGPFCYFLFDSWSNDSNNQYNMKVYRGAKLSSEMIECYKEAIGTYKCWYGFSSTSKNRQKAEQFGNTLFIIDLTQSKGAGLDISSYSCYPGEEEVLLPAGTEFKIIKVQSNIEHNKHCIYLTVITDLDNETNGDLCNKGLLADDARAVANALKINTRLCKLDISNNYICSEGARSIADALKSNKALTSLYISNNNISNEGATSIADALKINTRLGELVISNNNISNEGATSIADALMINQTLTLLNISNNNISNGGATSIADALKINKTLKILTISNNNISNEGVTSIKKNFRGLFLYC
ncbi:unnamed protein product [Didymodactylos carnosus]|uniref:WWE domain-containing protein n=1 Tax=Didymodactylos carnosus TaxID=1234261 RepID=A0A8S2D5T8_9BILA|nr:unnamed protein product [Didymodactylos carnosus]CAF3668507.1 unnamed protein product [Didymodactylos carnosus]